MYLKKKIITKKTEGETKDFVRSHINDMNLDLQCVYIKEVPRSEITATYVEDGGYENGVIITEFHNDDPGVSIITLYLNFNIRPCLFCNLSFHVF